MSYLYIQGNNCIINYFMDQCMFFPITDAINVGWSEKNAVCACKLILYA